MTRLLTRVVGIAGLAILFGADAPTSKKAVEAVSHHDTVVAKAASVYWRACVSADKSLIADLNRAISVARSNGDGAEETACRNALKDVESRLSNEESSALGNCPAAPLELLRFQRPVVIDDSKVPELKLAGMVANGPAIVGQRFKVSGVIFVAADTNVLDLPGVVDPDHRAQGQAVQVDPRTTDFGAGGGGGNLPPAPLGLWKSTDWINIAVQGQGGTHFSKIYVPTGPLRSAVGNLNQGQPVTFFGKVIELNRSGEFGIIVDKFGDK